ncbi:MAG: thiolase family protein, partial [bacterium]
MTRHAAITGVYDTPVGKVPGVSSLAMQADAALGAIAHSGLDAAEIDGVLCAYSIANPHPMLSSVVCEYLGLQPSFSAAIQAGGASACVMVMQAAALVEAGMCRHVLAVTGDNRLSGMTRDQAVAVLSAFGHVQFEQPYGINIPAAYALVAKRYMHEYGTTPEELAAIAVTHRKHAALNGKAHMQEPITVDDVCNSRLIAAPLRLLDCCLISDGGAAVVVSAPDAAADLPGPAVEILGTGQMNTHEHIMEAPSLTDFGCK